MEGESKPMTTSELTIDSLAGCAIAFFCFRFTEDLWGGGLADFVTKAFAGLEPDRFAHSSLVPNFPSPTTPAAREWGMYGNTEENEP
jgi:hypothetical protein